MPIIDKHTNYTLLIIPYYTCGSILDLLFCINSTLVSRVEIIPGISDHECVYAESSLRPSKTVTPPRKVHLYHKNDFELSKG